MPDTLFKRYGAFTRIRAKTFLGKAWVRNHPDALQSHGATMLWHGAIDITPRHAAQIAAMMRGDGLSVTLRGTTK